MAIRGGAPDFAALHPGYEAAKDIGMLLINNIEVVYDNIILVLKGVSLEAKPGSITTLLGGNGAGKTTTLKAVSGVLRSERGAVTKGTITLDGSRIDGMPAFNVTKLGISQV